MSIKITRRVFLGTTAAALAASTFAQEATGLRCVSKEVCIPTRDETGVFPGFITYIDREKPVLLHRYGWVDASDTYDNFHERISTDNGKTWSEPELKLKSHEVEGGRLRYVENGALFDPDTNLVIALVSRMLYPKDKIDKDAYREIVVDVYDPTKAERPEPQVHNFGFRQGLGISFCFPIKTSRGRIVVPAFHPGIDDDGNVRHHPDSGLPMHEVRMMLGDYTADGALEWRAGSALEADPNQSTRGLSESSPVELKDGRIALLCRGSNYKRPDLPGHKWLSFSVDQGETWGDVAPFEADDGTPLESGANGCALFRSIKNNHLYFIGNLCAPGERAQDNWPRSPLHIAEVQEAPFRLKRDTVAIIDERGPNDTERTQISNFRYYQDRATGEVVVFATRFGERDTAKWKMADHYEYRIALG